MTRHIHQAHTHCKHLKKAVFVLAVMTSASAMAATPATAADEARAADQDGRQLTESQAPVDQYEAIKWRNCSVKHPVAQSPVRKTSRFKTASAITRTDTGKVFKHDYERLLVPVGSSKNTTMIWLAD